MPIVSLCSFQFFKSPISYINTGCTESNLELSGFFGPNQVATILGLGMFVFFFRLVFISSTKVIIFVNVILLSYMYYRGLLTFSRGGIITGLAMIFVLLFFYYCIKINLYYHNLNILLYLFLPHY